MTQAAAAPSPEYITKEIAAEMLGISPRRVLELATSEKKLRWKESYNPDSHRRQTVLSLEDVKRLAAERQPSTALSAIPRSALPQLAASSTPASGPAPESRPFDAVPPCVRLTVKEAAAYLRIPEQQVRALIASGKLPAEKVGHTRVRRRDLDAL